MGSEEGERREEAGGGGEAARERAYLERGG